MSAAIGDLSITLEDGTVLAETTDLGLAWKWAKAVLGDDWEGLSTREQYDHVAQALAALRAAMPYEEQP